MNDKMKHCTVIFAKEEINGCCGLFIQFNLVWDQFITTVFGVRANINMAKMEEK